MTTEASTKDDNTLLSKGTMETYQIIEIIGKGTFSEVFLVRHPSGREYAAKVSYLKETVNYEMVREYYILYKATSAGVTEHFPKFVDSGNYNKRPYVVMELLGSDLSKIRKNSPDGRLEVQYVFTILRQIISALKYLHRGGIIHCDVKPSNICVKREDRNHVRLVDFGLSKRIGLSFVPATSHNILGTMKYASIPMHEIRKPAPADDLISLFYAAVELCESALPWGTERYIGTVFKMKREYRYDYHVKSLPAGFYKFYDYLIKLSDSDRYAINYTYLTDVIDYYSSSLS